MAFVEFLIVFCKKTTKPLYLFLSIILVVKNKFKRSSWINTGNTLTYKIKKDNITNIAGKSWFTHVNKSGFVLKDSNYSSCCFNMITWKICLNTKKI